jgi:uncharacterized protein YlzI (FlbEa/FlbD family)
MLIEFTRVGQHTHFGEDDDEELVREGTLISLNPANIAAVFAAREVPNSCIVRMNDGRGFIVQGSYEEVMGRLRPHHTEPSPLRAV